MIPFPLIAPPVFGYAEMHYRFKYFFSYLKKHEPEILADAPHRLEPGSRLPILLFIKDAHHYPVRIDSVTAALRTPEALEPITILLPVDQETIAQKFWWKVVTVPVASHLGSYSGDLSVDVEFSYTISDSQRQCRNDNYRTSTRRPLKVFISPDPLPKLPGWHLGDAHTHSHHTEDQVEFGAPPEASVRLSKAMGLSFFCVTDHSYDLDDSDDNYLINDPSLPKWNRLQREIDDINRVEQSFAVVRGEEVSCWNRARENVHLLLYGTRRFFHGSGDGAERWFRTTAEHTIEDVVSAIDGNVAAFAAHPLEPVPFLHGIFFGRGVWSETDAVTAGLHGLQIGNGERTEAFERGLALWTKLLLQGRRIVIAAGNDAHGNFNRYRQLGIPFLTIAEADRQLFGRMRTAVQLPSLNEANIVSALRDGRSAITNGPLASLALTKEHIIVEAISSPEFGPLTSIRIFSGHTGDESENIISAIDPEDAYSFSHSVVLPLEHISYIRLEVTSHGRGPAGFCITNPLWIST